VNSVPLQVLLYAFVAGASPVALGATLLVLGSRGGRWHGLAFAMGVVLGQAVVCALAFALGNATLPVALLVAAAIVWTRPPDEPAKPDSRARAVLTRLEHLNVVEVFGAGWCSHSARSVSGSPCS
jgi:hypothetical protein